MGKQPGDRCIGGAGIGGPAGPQEREGAKGCRWTNEWAGKLDRVGLGRQGPAGIKLG